jgi:hypothetical protein
VFAGPESFVANASASGTAGNVTVRVADGNVTAATTTSFPVTTSTGAKARATAKMMSVISGGTAIRRLPPRASAETG